jgi:hypothetical protein
MVGGGPAIGLAPVVRGLVHPVALVEAPDGTGRRFIVDQVGVIRVLLPGGTLLTTPFLDLRSRIVSLMPAYDERGLLGLAFHPDFRTNGKFYVYYTAPPRLAGFNNTSTVSEFHAPPGANVADAGSERVVLQSDHPQFNHDAGTLAFGPDGFLYISIGDGGGADDVGFGHVPDWYPVNAGGNGQDVTHNLMGNILRIDVNGVPYAIPPDNPFVGKPRLDEIWAYGFRNPYRFSFDRGGSHQLFVGDAGQNMWEEASIVVKGGNYGWNVKEGTHCFDAADHLKVLPSCPSVDAETGDPLIDPIVELPNEANPTAGPGIVVIVGGYVYRGAALPALAGHYVFGAFSTDEEEPKGAIYQATPRAGTGLWAVQGLPIATNPGGELGHYILGFGEDLSGDLYVLTTDNQGPTGTTGMVLRLTAPPPRVVAVDVLPTTISLSRTGTVTVYAYSTPTFDATQIDVASARLLVDDRGPGAAVARQGSSFFTAVRDVNGDGRPDRLLVFRTSDLVAAGLTTSSETLVLHAQAGGVAFVGQDFNAPSFEP